MIDKDLQIAVSEALKSLYNIDVATESVVLQKTKKEFEGDYTIVVFPFVKQARKSPEAVANELGAAVKASLPQVADFNVIKGFLNFSICDDYWKSFTDSIANDSTIGLKKVDTNAAPVVIEYSSPNTNKPLHLGHIRNNLLGWSVAQLLTANGRNVKKVNLVNDRGIHICKSMLAWLRYGNGETPESSGMKGDHLVGKYYVEFDKHYKEEIRELVEKGVEEEQAKKEAPLMVEAQKMLKRWEEGDKEIRSLWEKMNGWVYAGFDETYKKMGVGFDKIYYESNTYLLGKELVQKGLDMGVLFRKEDGSVWCDLTDAGLDQKLLLRKDGTSVYMTQDLGTALLRHNDFGADQLIYVVGNEQDYHFQVLKIILGRLGFDWADKVYHLSYGMVELPNGKMKSREGTVVDADDLIEEMEKTAEEMCRERGKNDEMSADEQKELYHILALGALKYFILKVDPTKTMLFNPAESIDFNGNTGPFIQYTYARIRSIVRKAVGEKGLDLTANCGNVAINEKEREVIKMLHDMPAVVEQAAASYSPAMIANFTFDLAKAFNSFYQDTPILRETDSNRMLFLVQLCAAVSNSIKNMMWILGIEVPERM
ncbi:MAG: arginine--tRNA ligase [Bacteroidales bacterium]|nr:arginine--tRNA ligase [Bacteroidales bacterium]MBR4715860.1 arginine--tRNA ligase [Bacteroidales bacterium]